MTGLGMAYYTRAGLLRRFHMAYYAVTRADLLRRFGRSKPRPATAQRRSFKPLGEGEGDHDEHGHEVQWL